MVSLRGAGPRHDEVMDATTLGWMRPGAQLVNVASGALVNAVALRRRSWGSWAAGGHRRTTWLEAWVRDVPNLI